MIDFIDKIKANQKVWIEKRKKEIEKEQKAKDKRMKEWLIQNEMSKIKDES